MGRFTLTRVLVLSAAVSAVALPAQAQLGSLLGAGAKVGMNMKNLKVSDEDEQKLGETISQKIRQQYGVVQDKAVHRYVSLVGLALASQSTRPNLQWHFIVLDTDGVNAFAAPGGYIHITKGALALMTSEAELADVLGHEIIHVTEKHAIKSIQNSARKDLALDVAPGGGLAKAGLDKLAGALYETVYAGYNRTEELESDNLGIVLANKVGYDPHGLGTFLMRLTDRNKAATEKQGLFASHPEMDERLKRLEVRISNEKLAATIVLADRYKKFVTYVPKPQSEIAQVTAGASGLAGGSTKPADNKTADKKDEQKSGGEEPKKKGGMFGMSKMLPGGGGEEKKSAQVTGSGAGRGLDSERNAKGGSNPALVAVSLTPADLAAFKKEGKLN